MSSEDEKRKREKERREKIKRRIRERKDEKEKYENKVKKLEDENKELKETNEKLEKANEIANDNIKYQNIQNKAISTIKSLNDAKNNMDNSLRNYNKFFSGEAANRGIPKYSNVKNSIDEVINELNNKIINGPNGVIKQMESNDKLINGYISKSVASFRKKL